MPGITGIIGKGSEQRSRAAIDAMVQCMRHEPFYTSGTYTNGAMGLWIGWTSLGGSFADCLPIWNEQKDICLIFSGEVFSDGEESGFLKSRGHQFEAENASYLVHLYEEIGLDFLKKLDGWFSGVLIDLRENKFFLFNDRYGVERIYFCETKDTTYFASEAKALLRVLPELRAFDEEGVAQFLTYGCTVNWQSLFRGVQILPGASVWSFEIGK